MAEMTSAHIRLTHPQKSQLELACERYSEDQGKDWTQQDILEMLIRQFCVSQGIRFDRKKRTIAAARVRANGAQPVKRSDGKHK